MNDSMSSLTDKQVINVCDGKILGYVNDFIVDPCNGRLLAIIIPAECGFFSFKKSDDTIIPWEKIVKIGIDVILVDIGFIPKSCSCENKEKKNS